MSEKTATKSGKANANGSGRKAGRATAQAVAELSKNSASTQVVESVSIEPQFVMRGIDFYRRILLQDAESARTGLGQARHNLPNGADSTTLSGYIRERLLISKDAGHSSPHDATASAWHPFILRYCEILGVSCEAVEQLFLRLKGGDLTDSRSLARESKLAKEDLDEAFELAESQWHDEVLAIHGPRLHLGLAIDDSGTVTRTEWNADAKLPLTKTLATVFRILLRNHEKSLTVIELRDMLRKAEDDLYINERAVQQRVSLLRGMLKDSLGVTITDGAYKLVEQTES